MRGRWELTEEQWEVVESVLRPQRRADKRGRSGHDTRAMVLLGKSAGPTWSLP
jgi:hypothetical protein